MSGMVSNNLICFTADRSVEMMFCRRTVSSQMEGKGVSKQTKVKEQVTPTLREKKNVW
jgi:hypothetical protein